MMVPPPRVAGVGSERSIITGPRHSKSPDSREKKPRTSNVSRPPGGSLLITLAGAAAGRGACGNEKSAEVASAGRPREGSCRNCGSAVRSETARFCDACGFELLD